MYFLENRSPCLWNHQFNRPTNTPQSFIHTYIPYLFVKLVFMIVVHRWEEASSLHCFQCGDKAQQRQHVVHKICCPILTIVGKLRTVLTSEVHPEIIFSCIRKIAIPNCTKWHWSLNFNQQFMLPCLHFYVFFVMLLWSYSASLAGIQPWSPRVGEPAQPPFQGRNV